MIMKGEIKMLIAEEKIVACAWDGGWFCDKCDSLHPWEEKAFVINGEKYCKKCLTKIKEDVIINTLKERK